MAAIAAYRIWKHALLWLGVLLLLMARVPLLWSSGEFVSEDGWVFFAGAFNAPWFESIITPFAGYFRFDARLIAEVVSVLPWAKQPYAYALVGLSLNAFIFSLIYLPGFRSVLANDASRAALVGLLALAPHAENLGLLTGQHWYLGYALALLLLMQMPSGLGGRVGVVLGASFCAWSSPSALVLLPFWAWNGFRSGDHFTKRLSAVVVVQLVLYALAMLVFRGTEGSRSAAFEVGDMAAAAGNLLGRGWLVSGLAGRGVAESVVSVAPLLADGLAVGLLLGIGFGVWRMSLNAWGAPVMFLGIGALMAVFSLTRTLYLSELAQLELPRHVRYLTAPTLLLIVGVWLMLGPWLASRWVKVVFVFQVLAFFLGGGWCTKTIGLGRQSYFDFANTLNLLSPLSGILLRLDSLAVSTSPTKYPIGARYWSRQAVHCIHLRPAFWMVSTPSQMRTVSRKSGWDRSRYWTHPIEWIMHFGANSPTPARSLAGSGLSMEPAGSCSPVSCFIRMRGLWMVWI